MWTLRKAFGEPAERAAILGGITITGEGLIHEPQAAYLLQATRSVPEAELHQALTALGLTLEGQLAYKAEYGHRFVVLGPERLRDLTLVSLNSLDFLKIV